LQEYDYSQPGMYFVTICARDGQCLFGEIVDSEMILNNFGIIVVDVWNEIPQHFSGVELDAFVVMPNHVHGINSIIEDVSAYAIRTYQDHQFRRMVILSYM
jgi:REP element-mobilizing transposase RayT